MSSRFRQWRKSFPKSFQNLFDRNETNLFSSDGTLIDVHRLRNLICSTNLSMKQRQLIWPYLLNVYSPPMTKEEKDQFHQQTKIHYEKLKHRWQQRLIQSDPFYIRLADKIIKDLSHTDQHIHRLKKNKSILFNVMMTYSVNHPDPGYSQGMIEMLGVIFYVFNDESFSYVCYCSLMNRYMNSHFDRHEKEFSRRIRLFYSIFSSINVQLCQKFSVENEISLNYLYRCFILDCKREFSTYSQIVRVVELVWLHSMTRFATTLFTSNDQSLFSVVLSISIIEEDQNNLNQNLSRSKSSMKRILKRAQFYHSIYSSN